MKMGAFLGVNKGGLDEPRLIHIRYTRDKQSKEIISLIGKGVMYDTGCYSLNTVNGMPNMKCDMAGVATALGLIVAALGTRPHHLQLSVLIKGIYFAMKWLRYDANNRLYLLLIFSGFSRNITKFSKLKIRDLDSLV